MALSVKESEEIVQKYFKNNFPKYTHFHDKVLKVNNSSYRIKPDENYQIDNEVIVIEYENTKLYYR